MNLTIRFTLILFLFSGVTQGQTPISYFLDKTIDYNPEIPTPSSILGHEVGEWHVSHDKLVRYMEVLAESSDRISLQVTGRTYENRPLLLLTVTSPPNHDNLESLRQKHLTLSDPSQDAKNLDDIPMVVYMGYSIHGNEASGSNASLLVAYHLAAARGPEIDALLDKTIILIDPSFNPDGLNRFASWVNSRKSITTVSDPNAVEFNEPWPGGRTNHYWFDLNRDWLPAQLTESQARLKTFHHWKPNILTDHHEMGTNSTFFFQPGIPSRNNPLTPAETYRLTEEMGKFHAAALDEIGSLYYTKESYDDYYYGKGSTYPDINGAVGILFEQASSRGHEQENDFGTITFPFTIRNQFVTSLSTLKAALELRNDFLLHQKKFYRDALKVASQLDEKVYLIGSRDKSRLHQLGQLIARHDIIIHHVKEGTTINGIRYPDEELLGIPLDQPQFKLIEAMFETRTEFTDSLFYDISTWTLPLAFGVDFRPGGTRDADLLGERFEPASRPAGELITNNGTPYAYVFEPYGYYAHRAIYELLDEGYTIRLANEPFRSGDVDFPRGSIMIPVSLQPNDVDSLNLRMAALARDNELRIRTVTSGLDYSGKSLGSPSFTHIEKPRTGILVGDGIRSYDAGEIWHLMDQRFHIPATLLSADDISRVDLERYNVLIMVSGRYSLDDNRKDKLKEWVRAGGTLLAFGSALPFLNSMGLGNFEFKSPAAKDSTNQRPYGLLSETRGAQEIGGSIFNAKADLTNPLFYGFYQQNLALFKNDEQFLAPAGNPFANPLLFTMNPLESGYISPENARTISGTSAIGISSSGSGRVIGFNFNPVFRAFWLGTNKILLNAMFYGRGISSGATR